MLSDYEQGFIKINEQYFGQLDNLQNYSKEEKPLISWSQSPSQLKDSQRRDKEFKEVRRQFEEPAKVDLLLLDASTDEANRETINKNPNAFLALMKLKNGKYALWGKQNGKWIDTKQVIDPDKDECIEEIKQGYQNKQGKMVVKKNDKVAKWLESKKIFLAPLSLIYANDMRYLVDGKPLRRSYLCTRNENDEIVDIVALSSSEDRNNGKIHLIGEGSYANVMLGQKENGEYCAVRQITVRQGPNHLKALYIEDIKEQAQLMEELGLSGGGYAINGGSGYQVMDRVGNDLEKHLNNNALTNLDRVKASRKVVRGLKSMHDNDYTHGDGKAGNILRVRKKDLVDKENPQSEDNYDYIWIDLDKVVKSAGDEEFFQYNVEHNKMGTTFYMPNKNSRYTRKQADVYSLAKILRTSKRADFYDFKKNRMVENKKVIEKGILSDENITDSPELARLLDTRKGCFVRDVQDVKLEKIEIELAKLEGYYNNVENVIKLIEEKIKTDKDLSGQQLNDYLKSRQEFTGLKSNELAILQRELTNRAKNKTSVALNQFRKVDRGFAGLWGGNGPAWNAMQQSLQKEFSEKFMEENEALISGFPHVMKPVVKLIVEAAAKIRAKNDHQSSRKSQEILENLEAIMKSPSQEREAKLMQAVNRSKADNSLYSLLDKKSRNAINSTYKNAKQYKSKTSSYTSMNKSLAAQTPIAKNDNKVRSQVSAKNTSHWWDSVLSVLSMGNSTGQQSVDNNVLDSSYAMHNTIC